MPVICQGIEPKAISLAGEHEADCASGAGKFVGFNFLHFHEMENKSVFFLFYWD